RADLLRDRLVGVARTDELKRLLLPVADEAPPHRHRERGAALRLRRVPRELARRIDPVAPDEAALPLVQLGPRAALPVSVSWALAHGVSVRLPARAVLPTGPPARPGSPGSGCAASPGRRCGGAC